MIRFIELFIYLFFIYYDCSYFLYHQNPDRIEKTGAKEVETETDTDTDSEDIFAVAASKSRKKKSCIREDEEEEEKKPTELSI